MSRTFRNRCLPLIVYHVPDTDTEINTLVYRYYSDSDSGRYGLPKHFRKQTNKQRKSIDKQELNKALQDSEYVPNMCAWNGKSGNSWYWW